MSTKSATIQGRTVSLSPLHTIWVKPRATIRRLISADSSKHVLQLAMAGGVAQSLGQAMETSLGDRADLYVIIAGALVIGSLWGLGLLYVGGSLVHWTGRWLGGRGSRRHLRMAMGWSSVPYVVFLPLTGVVVALIGKLPFVSEEVMQESYIAPWAWLVLMLYWVIGLILAVWSFVILLNAIGEVQGFSAWKAWGNLMLSGAVVIIPLLLLLPLPV